MAPGMSQVNIYSFPLFSLVYIESIFRYISNIIKILLELEKENLACVNKTKVI